MKAWWLPVATVYGGVVRARNWLFDRNLFKSTSFAVPIISVGNLSAGGTGKTPIVAHLAEELRRRGRSVAIVSRGYGGNYQENAIQVQSDLPDAAARFGDEPAWYAETLQVPVFVGRSRVKAVELCLERATPDVILADDGFQHRWLARSKDIVLLDALETSRAMLPAGRFREPLKSLRRADFVVLTKSNLASPALKNKWIRRAGRHGFSFTHQNFFEADYNIEILSARTGAALAAPQVVAASGIARPESFRQNVEAVAQVKEHLIRKDHWDWTSEDMIALLKMAKEAGDVPVVVTEKDWIKMKHIAVAELDIFVARLKIRFNPEFPYEQLI